MRFLDYKKVKDMEREKAKELFGTAAQPSALVSKVSFHSHQTAMNIILIENRLWVLSPKLSTSLQRMALQQTRHPRTTESSSRIKSERRSKK